MILSMHIVCTNPFNTGVHRLIYPEYVTNVFPLNLNKAHEIDVTEVGTRQRWTAWMCGQSIQLSEGEERPGG